MPSRDDKLFLKACKGLCRQRPFNELIRKKYGKQANQILECFGAEKSLTPDLEAAADDAIEFLENEAPVVKEYEAEQDEGVYKVTIRGFSGVYFVQAIEYDDSEVFITLKQAKEYVMENYGEFLC